MCRQDTYQCKSNVYPRQSQLSFRLSQVASFSTLKIEQDEI